MRCAHPVAGPRLRPGLKAAQPSCGRGYARPALPADRAESKAGDALLRTPRGLFVFCLLRFGPCRGFFFRKR